MISGRYCHTRRSRGRGIAYVISCGATSGANQSHRETAGATDGRARELTGGECLKAVLLRHGDAFSGVHHQKPGDAG